MKNFCALPFDSVTMFTDGTFQICCDHKTPSEFLVNINDHDHDHWLKSDYVQEVRNSFSQDQKHPGCKGCWQREDAGLESQRMRYSKDFQILPNNPDRPIKHVEIQLGNLCNLKCLMCFETFSSAILAENTRLGINKINQKDMDLSDTAYQNLRYLLSQRPYTINVRGGEPLYNKKLLELLDEIPPARARDMLLHITTNGTQWNQQWQSVIEKFRLVRFMFSIDATGDLYEYIRYPSQWHHVESNVKAIMSLPNTKCLVHCVGQNLNVSYMSSLIDWCRTHGIYLEIDALLSPNYMQIDNLPTVQKKLARAHLDDLLKIDLRPDLKKFIQSARDLVARDVSDPDLWQQFVKNISMRDNLRNNSFRKFIKED